MLATGERQLHQQDIIVDNINNGRLQILSSINHAVKSEAVRSLEMKFIWMSPIIRSILDMTFKM